MDQETLAEYRYRAVCEVLGGSPIGEVAARYGTSRQSLHTWRQRFQQEGMPGLADRSRRPRTSPSRVIAEIEALTCQLRRQHPRWGARRISHELGRHGADPTPSRATVHRILVRNGLIDPQAQQHKRKYKRWQRAEPMHLWQMDIVGGVPLADGRSCKLVTGIDDHSRFVVIAAVVAVPSGRAICAAFTEAMRRYGVPSEVLTDNGGQFTGRFIKPQPVEVMFERICRDNGIKQRLTKPSSPTTTGKVERLHKTLREEFLDHVAPFESIAAAQAAIDGWVESYNRQRLHQALDMATPASLFRPNGPTRLDLGADPGGVTDTDDPFQEVAPHPDTPGQLPAASTLLVDVIEPPALLTDGAVEGAAVEFQARVPPSGQLTVCSGRQSIGLHESMAGRLVTVWADLRSVHVSLDGHVMRTVASRLRPEDLRHLAMRGARPAGLPPAKPALRRRNGIPVLPEGGAVEIERSVTKDGQVTIAGSPHLVGFAWAGRKVSLRLDGHLMHAIADNALIGTWPCPVSTDRLAGIHGARTPSTPLPPPPLPAGSLRAQRKVHATGRIMVGGQRIKFGPRHRGKVVTVVIEDTHLRVLHGDEEIAVRPRRDLTPITRLHVTGAGVNPGSCQASPDDKTSSKS
ncbi:IS481 family transposase ISMva2 [Kutzneria sp. CA-103260]|nr:IS481 family transposase [Kutzneria sp. CA-103260]QUQ68283.1 IS481 family transposase ISMva2 [Kutzneria sp. CA-103260]